LNGSPLHYFYEASQFLVDLAKPAGAQASVALQLSVPNQHQFEIGE